MRASPPVDGAQAHPHPDPLPEGEGEKFAVDGLVPRLFAAPASYEEAAQVLAWAGHERLAVIPRGGGTRLGLGNVPRAADLVLSTERLADLVEYEPANLTVTVGAGMRLSDLQDELGRHGQFLPLDPPAAPGSTVGGVVATNASGPSRLRYGAARDLVIGTRVANTSGVVTKAGGKVVKNVTGYDLNKLYVGSLGTVGLIVELTFKVQPLPDTTHTFVARFPSIEAACRAVSRTLRSPLTPTALEVTRDESAYVLSAHVGGFAKTVERTVGDLTTFAREEGAESSETTEDDAVWAQLREGPNGGARLKMAVPIGEVAWAIGAIEEAALVGGLRAEVQASAGVGVVRAALDGGDLGAAVRRLRAQAREHLGSLVVEECPLELKREIDVFGDPPDGFELMRRLKRQLDPDGVLNPGRFLGRL